VWYVGGARGWVERGGREGGEEGVERGGCGGHQRAQGGGDGGYAMSLVPSFDPEEEGGGGACG